MRSLEKICSPARLRRLIGSISAWLPLRKAVLNQTPPPAYPQRALLYGRLVQLLPPEKIGTRAPD